MKPRPEAKLKTLPDAVQAALYALYQKKSGAECLSWLKDSHGVKSSTGALSNFAAWYPFSRPLEMVASRAKAFEQQLKANPALNLNAEQVSAAGQIAFEQVALQMQDIKGFINLRKLRLKEVDQAHDARRIALLEKKAQQADAAEGVTRDETLTPAQREAKLKEIFGLKG
jgi:hypothetical protein